MRKKRFKRTFLTEEEFRVLTVLLKYGRVSDVARILGRAQPTISIIKKRIEEKIDMALETIKLALSLGVISRDTLVDLINSVGVQSTPVDLRSEWLLDKYLSTISEVTGSTIKRSAPGLLELLELYTTREEKRVKVIKTQITEKPTTTLLTRHIKELPVEDST